MAERMSRSNTSMPGAPISKPDVVTVASKLPNGVWLRLFKFITVPEMTPQGSRDIKVARECDHEGYQRYRLRPARVPLGMAASYPIVAGYSLTEIPTEFWETWCEQNKDSDMLKSRNVFSYEGEMGATERAREQSKEGVRSGFEPVDPKKPPVVGIQTYDGAKTGDFVRAS